MNIVCIVAFMISLPCSVHLYVFQIVYNTTELEAKSHMFTKVFPRRTFVPNVSTLICVLQPPPFEGAVANMSPVDYDNRYAVRSHVSPISPGKHI